MKTSIRNDQRGVGAVVVIVAVIVLAGIGFAGWRMMQKDNVTKNATPAQKAAITACEKAFKDKDLCKFTGNYSLDKLPYKVVLTGTDAKGAATSMTMLSDGKGNTSLSSTTSGQEFASIELNGDSYLKGTDGTWIKYPKSDSSAPTTTAPTSDIKFNTTVDNAAASTITYKKIGKEACGKLTCLKYQVVDKANPGTTQFFWFDTKDYRMQRYSSKDANGTTDMVITYQAVNITAPSPVKDFSAGAGIDTQALQAQAAAAAAASAAASASTDSTSTDNGQ